MIYEDTKYRKESEIDNAFVYLKKLNNELEKLKKENNNDIIYKSNNTTFKNWFKKKSKIESYSNDETIIKKSELLKSEGFKKDGYFFRIRLYKIFNEYDKNQILYYEFYANIKYVNTTIKKQFYKKILDKNDAITYFNNMTAVFRILSRRDLMERLFKEKEEEIIKLKKNIIQEV